MKRSVWNSETRQNETVTLAEDRGAWLTALTLLGFGLAALGGTIFVLFG